MVEVRTWQTGRAHMVVRVLEPEVMDSEEEAREYNDMNHAEVNARFCSHLLEHDPVLDNVLDVGTGTALIPIELCRRMTGARVVAIDLADWMLALGKENVAREGLSSVISVEKIDAKRLPFADGSFTCVMSNSIIHHIEDPRPVFAEMLRVLRPGGVLFVRDLFRPDDEDTVRKLVTMYVADETLRQQKLFEDSLRAAFTVDEIRALVADFGVPATAVSATSDRHWTLAHRT